MTSGDRAVIYTRQSTLREESISLELQRIACSQYCAARGYTVVDVLEDPGVSGLQFARRPGVRRALSMAEAGDVDVIVVWRWSRLSRRRLDQAVILDGLERAGARAESATEPIDTTTAGGRFSREVLLAAAAMESEVKSEQFKEAHARRVANGMPSSGIGRFGYTKGPDKRFYPDPVTGPLLARCYRKYIAGAGAQSLAKELNDAGVTTTKGSPWSVVALLRAMDSGFGAGLIALDKGTRFVKGAHAPVISPEEWDAYRRARDRRRRAHPKQRTARWHLAGLVRCGLCGAPMTVNSYTSTKSQVVCSAYKASRTCKGVWVNRTTVEHVVAVWLGGRVDELARYAWDDTQRAEERSRLVALVDARAARLRDLESALGRLATGWAKGLLDDAGYQAARNEIEVEVHAAGAELEDAKEQLSLLAPIGEDVYERLVAGTQDMDTGEWNGLLRRVVASVTVTDSTITVVPLSGEPDVIPRPHDRTHARARTQARGANGRFTV